MTKTTQSKTKLLMMAMCLGTMVSAAQARAELNASASAGAEYLQGGYNNAKANEYHYLFNQPWGYSGSLGLSYSPDLANPFFQFVNLDASGRQDQDGDISDADSRLSLGAYGLYRADFSFDQIGHNFAFGSKTLYTGTGTSQLRMDTDERKAVQLVGATTPAGLNLLKSYLDAALQTDMALRRDKTKGKLLVTPLEGLELSMNVDQESRTGSRPMGASFGFSNAIEIPEPINYSTINFGGQADYTHRFGQAGLIYQHSSFYNAYTSVLYDNPLRNTDSAAGGAAMGRTSLPPSNQMDSLDLSLAGNLPLRTRISGSAGYSLLRQNDPFLPATSNTKIALNALPESSLDGQVDNSRMRLEFASRPWGGLHAKAVYAYNQHQNNTTVMDFQSVAADAGAISVVSPEFVSSVEHKSGVEAGYELFKTDLTVGADKKLETFTNGSAQGEAEDTYRVSLDNHTIQWVSGRLSLERIQRLADYPDYTSDDNELPWMRKFYAADVDRNQTTAMVTLFPRDDLTVTLEYTYGRDDYRNSIFGLLNSEQHAATMAIDYQAAERLSVSPSYTYDTRFSNQRDRQWTAGGKGDPYAASALGADPVNNPNNWTLLNTENVQTVGLEAKVDIFEAIWNLNLDGTYSVSAGRADFASVKGSAAVDNNAFTPRAFASVDGDKWINLGAKTTYKIFASLGVTARYQYQNWEINDDINTGYQQIAVTGTGAYAGLLTLNSLPKSYEVQTIYAGVDYTY